MRFSVVIPSYKDPYLQNTILDILQSHDSSDLEIIVVLDGYKPKSILERKKVKYVFLGANRGMRGAINTGVSISKGECVLVCDEHCMFAPGFLHTLAKYCPEKGLTTALRYSLDPVEWAVMEGAPTGYERMIIHEGRFVGERWRNRDRHRKNLRVDENMAMQGSCYFMRRDWWDKIGILQEEGYGPFAQEAPEILFKTWKAGGRLILNKRTWYAHKHRKFGRTHHAGQAITGPGNAYALATWKEYYEKEIVPRWFQ